MTSSGMNNSQILQFFSFEVFKSRTSVLWVNFILYYNNTMKVLLYGIFEWSIVFFFELWKSRCKMYLLFYLGDLKNKSIWKILEEEETYDYFMSELSNITIKKKSNQESMCFVSK